MCVRVGVVEWLERVRVGDIDAPHQCKCTVTFFFSISFYISFFYNKIVKEEGEGLDRVRLVLEVVERVKEYI